MAIRGESGSASPEAGSLRSRCTYLKASKRRPSMQPSSEYADFASPAASDVSAGDRLSEVPSCGCSRDETYSSPSSFESHSSPNSSRITTKDCQWSTNSTECSRVRHCDRLRVFTSGTGATEEPAGVDGKRKTSCSGGDVREKWCFGVGCGVGGGGRNGGYGRHRHRSFSSSSTWRYGWWTAVPLLVLCCLTSVEAQLRPVTDLSNGKEDGVCQSVDIRNSVEHLNRLRGCRVVEGFVQILLIDHASEENYTNISFPELREITGYLFLYRVNGLKTLEHLFPNLAVIRGHTLFYNYALVAFEVLSLQRIGLHSLTDILRGAVLFEKNPLLCFVDTIEWDLIAKNGKGEHVIRGNKEVNQCPICAPNSKCPTSPTTNASLCWNGTKCQKVCPDNCEGRACDERGACCHEMCLGSCRGPHTTDCHVCRDVVYNGECMKRCPFNTYEYLNRRCIQEKECLNMPTPPELDVPKSWKTFNGSCILECPPGYVEITVKGVDGNYTQCERCNDSCPKECEGASINNIASAQNFRGCTYIKGSLEIHIKGGKNIVKELEENLNMIEEIQGFLKVVRSFPLVSLNFLKNLSIIHGEILEYEKYSLVVQDNQNLQELWDWSGNRPIVQVKRGRPFFHFNPKLCLYKIEKLMQPPNFTNFTGYEVDRNSNGDKVACNVTLLKANVTQLHANVAVISWEHFQHYDPRSLLGYVLYSIEAPTKNITLYDGRDACGGDGWVVDDVSVPVGDPKEIYHIITKLKPYTQYAFYVRTYTVATEITGAQSEIHYFRTKPDTPSNAINLKAHSNSSDELVVEWQPPLYPNGNITHYLVVGTWEKDDQAFLEQRDYCFEPLALPDKKANVVVQEVDSRLTEKECMKECDERNARVNDKEEKDIQSQIRFEDYLHNKVYVKRPRKTRDIVSGSEAMSSYRNFEILKMRENQMNRGIPDMMESSTITLSSPYMNDHPSSSVTPSYDNSPDSSPIIPSFQHKVEGTKIVIGNLRHFAEYNIAVQACREETPEERREKAKNKNVADKTCSSKSIVTARTRKLEVADNVDQNQLSIEVSNQTAASVKIKWEEPEKPNGLVVTYQIEYRRTDIENFKPLVECITRRRYLENGHSYTLRNLQPGSYSLRLRATSLAGNGEFTEPKIFIVQDPPSNTKSEQIVLGLVGTLAILVALFGYYVYKKKFGPKTSDLKLIASVNPEYVSAVYIPDEWEVARKKIELIRELGQGSFGMVYEGIARDIVEGKPEMRCAIKTVNEHATDRERIEFLNEASVMKAFNTHHVVRLLGVVSQGQPTLVVMELMANGDLKTYLRSHRPDASAYHGKQPPTLKRILQMAIEIADGMAYLSAKKFVHRDLAARNCMVADDLTVKIGDFGMTRDIYETDYYRKGTKGLLPVRWMAPESLKDGVFTSYSDVWSYGVVLWEMATLASQPYQGLSNDQVLRYVIDGGVMERPENCPDKLYELMRICWQHKPVARPTFLTLVSMLEADVTPSFATVSFYHSHEGEEVRNHNTAPIVVPQLSRTLPQGARIAEVEDDDDEEEGEVGGATQTPTTPLRLTRDVEDFSVEDDSASERESSPDEDDDEEEGGDGEGSKGFPRHRERKGSGGEGGAKMHGGSSGRWASTGGDGSKGMSVYSSDSSKGSKVSNGSAAANGYMMGRHNSSGVLKTTEC